MPTDAVAGLVSPPLVIFDVGCRWGFAEAWLGLGDRGDAFYVKSDILRQDEPGVSWRSLVRSAVLARSFGFYDLGTMLLRRALESGAPFGPELVDQLPPRVQRRTAPVSVAPVADGETPVKDVAPPEAISDLAQRLNAVESALQAPQERWLKVRSLWPLRVYVGLRQAGKVLQGGSHDKGA